MSALIRLLSLLAATLLLAACATPGHSPTTLRPFTTDGCSLFPDRSADGKKDWHCCCVQHDRRYWRGGQAACGCRPTRNCAPAWPTPRAMRACAGDVCRCALRLGALADELPLGLWLGLWAGYAPLTEAEQRRRIGWRGEYAASTGFDSCPRAPASAVAASMPRLTFRLCTSSLMHFREGVARPIINNRQKTGWAT